MSKEWMTEKQVLWAAGGEAVQVQGRVGWKDPDVGLRVQGPKRGQCSWNVWSEWRGGGEVGGGAAECSESQGPHYSHTLSTSKQGQHIKSSHLCFLWCVAPSAVFSERVRRGPSLSREKGSLETLINSVGSWALWRFKRTLHPRDVSETRPWPLGP